MIVKFHSVVAVCFVLRILYSLCMHLNWEFRALKPTKLPKYLFVWFHITHWSHQSHSFSACLCLPLNVITWSLWMLSTEFLSEFTIFPILSFLCRPFLCIPIWPLDLFWFKRVKWIVIAYANHYMNICRNVLFKGTWYGTKFASYIFDFRGQTVDRH